MGWRTSINSCISGEGCFGLGPQEWTCLCRWTNGSELRSDHPDKTTHSQWIMMILKEHLHRKENLHRNWRSRCLSLLWISSPKQKADGSTKKSWKNLKRPLSGLLSQQPHQKNTQVCHTNIALLPYRRSMGWSLWQGHGISDPLENVMPYARKFPVKAWTIYKTTRWEKFASQLLWRAPKNVLVCLMNTMFQVKRQYALVWYCMWMYYGCFRK